MPARNPSSMRRQPQSQRPFPLSLVVLTRFLLPPSSGALGQETQFAFRRAGKHNVFSPHHTSCHSRRRVSPLRIVSAAWALICNCPALHLRKADSSTTYEPAVSSVRREDCQTGQRSTKPRMSRMTRMTRMTEGSRTEKSVTEKRPPTLIFLLFFCPPFSVKHLDFQFFFIRVIRVIRGSRTLVAVAGRTGCYRPRRTSGSGYSLIEIPSAATS